MSAHKAGCYYCEDIFSENEIRDCTIDNMAICPYCGVDSIYVGDDVSPLMLRELHREWFERECPEPEGKYEDEKHKDIV